MPDPKLTLQALSLAIASAFVLQLLLSRLITGPARSFVASVVLLVSFMAGALWLGSQPRFPPIEDQDRLLLVLLPVLLIAESIAAWVKLTGMKWLARVAVATATIPILLHGTAYLKDGALHETAGGVSIFVALVCLSAKHLEGPAQRSPRLVGYCFALTALAAGLTVLLSGYFSAGLLGLILAASILGSNAGAHLARDSSQLVFVPLICIASLLVVGTYFGTLPVWIGVMVVIAPNLLQVMELPFLTSVPRGLRKVMGVLAVGTPLAVVVLSSVRSFEEDSAPSSIRSDGSEPSASDYLNFKSSSN